MAWWKGTKLENIRKISIAREAIAFSLYTLGGYSQKEISELFDVSPGRVHQMVWKGSYFWRNDVTKEVCPQLYEVARAWEMEGLISRRN